MRHRFALLLLTVTAVVSVSLPATQAQQVLALTNASVVDTTKGVTQSGQTVIISGGRIERFGPGAEVSIPEGASRTDLRGAFLTPGLISAHVHVSDVHGLGPRAYTDENTLRQLGVFARYGITSVLSLGGELAPAFTARVSQRASGLNRARLFVAGDVLNPKTPDEARSDVARMAALRVDWIKIRVDDNLGTATKMAKDVFTAVITEAHARNLKVAAHIYYLDDAKALLKAGVDMIAHSVRDREIDEEFIALMKARSVPYCPTLTRELSTFVYETTPEFFADPFFLREADAAVVARLKEPARQEVMRHATAAQTYKAQLPVAMKNLKRATDAGLLVVMGTDSGPFPERFQGYFEHLELAMMADAGLTPAQILRAATVDAARGAGMRDVGTIAMGRWADLAAFERNPLEDVRHSKTLSAVWIGGQPIHR